MFVILSGEVYIEPVNRIKRQINLREAKIKEDLGTEREQFSSDSEFYTHSENSDDEPILLNPVQLRKKQSSRYQKTFGNNPVFR